LSDSADSNRSPDAGPLEPGTWQEQVRVHAYDVDFLKRATPEAICRWFLEAAWNHAEHLGVGFAELAAQGKLWVLSRIFIQIDRYPEWGQALQLRTWPKGTSGVFALRHFELHALDGCRLAAGSSSWLVLSATHHRPQRVDKLLLQIPTETTQPVATRDPVKLAPAELKGTQFSATVGYSDIDVNRHVNSAKYVNWCLDSYPAEFHERHSLRSFELNYLGETKWQDQISVFTSQPGPLRFAHCILNGRQEEVCRAEFIWDQTGR
jgi:medium-chain acyl-[acyl-carrier-protein] hydrolase